MFDLLWLCGAQFVFLKRVRYNNLNSFIIHSLPTRMRRSKKQEANINLQTSSSICEFFSFVVQERRATIVQYVSFIMYTGIILVNRMEEDILILKQHPNSFCSLYYGTIRYDTKPHHPPRIFNRRYLLYGGIKLLIPV